MTETVYCVDTSTWIQAGFRAYPHDIFGSFWAKVDALVNSDRAVSPLEVLNELEQQADDTYEWCRQRKSILIVQPDVEIQEAVRNVNKQFPSLVDLRKMRGLGDPWVVATAQVLNCTVVTEESSFPKTPRIPDACRALKIPCVKLLDLIRAEGWSWP